MERILSGSGVKKLHCGVNAMYGVLSIFLSWFFSILFCGDCLVRWSVIGFFVFFLGQRFLCIFFRKELKGKNVQGPVRKSQEKIGGDHGVVGGKLVFCGY